jgi:excinuclease ABC subunit B
LDIPECGLVAILDADKEGFLRSKTSLIQTIGRAARNVDGKAILYADKMTNSMKGAIEETSRRRERQVAWNASQGITPESIKKNIHNVMESVYERGDRVVVASAGQGALGMSPAELQKHIKKLEAQMKKAASDLDFENAARLRDEIRQLEAVDLGLTGTVAGPLQKDAKKKFRKR